MQPPAQHHRVWGARAGPVWLPPLRAARTRVSQRARAGMGSVPPGVGPAYLAGVAVAPARFKKTEVHAQNAQCMPCACNVRALRDVPRGRGKERVSRRAQWRAFVAAMYAFREVEV